MWGVGVSIKLFDGFGRLRPTGETPFLPRASPAKGGAVVAFKPHSPIDG